MSQPPASQTPSPFQSVAVEAVFPTPLWLVDLAPAVAEPLNRHLAAEVLRLIEPRRALPPGANWQTDPVIHRRPAFAEVCQLVLQAAKGAQSFLKVSGGALAITGAWANVNPPGGLNSAHGHPNNWLSAVYYVQIPPGTGAIRFADPRPQAQVLMPPVSERTGFTANDITVEAKPGRLVLFPGWLLHSVPVNRSQQERISLAFNLMFRDFTAEMSAPLWQGTAPLKD